MGGQSVPPVPDWRIYKVEECPELVDLQKRLADKGLKDPWLRNEVWRFQKPLWSGSRYTNAFHHVFRGFRYAFGATVLTIVAHTAYTKMKGETGDHHH